MKKLDNFNHAALIHYDDASKVLYVSDKGSTATHFWYYHESSNEGTPVLQ